MRHRWILYILCAAVLFSIGGAFVFKSRVANRQILSLPENPKVGDLILSGSFSADSKVCIQGAYSDCGLLCTVPEGKVMIYAEFQGSGSWEMELDSTVQIADPGYREIRYYNENACLEMASLESFFLRIASVKKAGVDTEAIIEIGR